MNFSVVDILKEIAAMQKKYVKYKKKYATFSAKPSDVERSWHVVDANNQVLGRLASSIAKILMGKHKPMFTKHIDTGDYVIVINAKSIIVTGNKTTDKIYYRHTGYPGGIKEISFKHFMEKSPVKVLTLAVKGMLPKGPLGYAMIKKLKIYDNADHPHTAQQPIAFLK